MKPEAYTLTLRDAFEKHHLSELSNPKTIKTYRMDLSRWERLTSNPPVAEITNRTLAEFRGACLADGLSPATSYSSRILIRVVMRRLAPQETGNPMGEGIIDRVPYVKKLREDRPFPRVWSLEEISAMYEACDVSRAPRGEVPAPDWWRALLAVGFNLIPRRADLSNMTLESARWDDGVLRWTARKTRKWHVLPMNAVVQEHLRLIWGDREYLWSRNGKPLRDDAWRGRYGLMHQFHKIQQAAGLPDRCGLHTLRKTGASYLNSTVPGIADVIGGWGLKGIAQTHYLTPTATGDLVRAVTNLPQPPAFLKIFDAPETRPTPTRTVDWEFTATSATWRGVTIAFHKPILLRALQLFVTATRALTTADLQALLFLDSPKKVWAVVNHLRRKLNDFPLPPMFDPIPFVDSGYILRLP